MSMFPIATKTLNSATSSIVFNNIPQTFTHLQIRAFGRGDVSFSSGLSFYVQLNGDATAANYNLHALFGEGSSAYSSSSLSTGTLSLQQVFADLGATTGIFGVGICDLLDYTNTNKYKTARFIGGHDNNGSGRASFGSGCWFSTAAINQVTISTDGNLVAGTTVQLYGITTA